MELELLRTYLPSGTNGEILYKGQHVVHTIELPWKDNHRGVSCIPEGRYALKKRYNTRFGWHLLVENVPARDGILIHPANDAARELHGCISPVSMFTGEGRGVLSREALKKLNLLVSDALDREEQVLLTIKIRSA